MAVPVNSVLPVISATVEVGYTLTSTTGTWSAGPQSFAFQWQRVNDNIVDISGATNNQYIITANDTGYKLQVRVIATNNSGDSLPAVSAETVTIPDDWFIVEDGTAKADAVSYATINYANDYHARRGNQAWGNLSIGEKKAAMVKAAEYLVEKYRMRFKGERVSTTQSLDWPRNWVEYADYQFITRNGAQVIGGFLYYPSNEVPEEVKAAQAELKSCMPEGFEDFIAINPGIETINAMVRALKSANPVGAANGRAPPEANALYSSGEEIYKKLGVTPEQLAKYNNEGK